MTAHFDGAPDEVLVFMARTSTRLRQVQALAFRHTAMGKDELVQQNLGFLEGIVEDPSDAVAMAELMASAVGSYVSVLRYVATIDKADLLVTQERLLREAEEYEAVVQEELKRRGLAP